MVKSSECYGDPEDHDGYTDEQIALSHKEVEKKAKGILKPYTWDTMPSRLVHINIINNLGKSIIYPQNKYNPYFDDKICGMENHNLLLDIRKDEWKKYQ